MRERIPGIPCLDVYAAARVRVRRGAVTYALPINLGRTALAVFVMRARNHRQDWRRGWWQGDYRRTNWYLESGPLGRACELAWGDRLPL